MREASGAIHEADLSDITKLQAVLKEAQFSSDDLLVDATRYWLAEDGQGSPVGVVGLELGISAVLLGSAAVSS